MDSSNPTNLTTFDPFNQTITLLSHYGTSIEPVDIPMHEFIFIYYQNMYIGLTTGAQLGLASLMLVTLLLLTAPGKRSTPIYLLNVTALVLDLLRSTCLSIWLVSGWNHPVTLFTTDFSNIRTGDIANSVLVNIWKTLELAVILTSLLLQIKIILSTTIRPLYRHLTLSLAATLALVTLCVQLATMVVNNQNIVGYATMEYLGLQERLADLTRVMTLVVTSFFLLVFAGKLGVAIWERRRLNVGVGGGKGMGVMGMSPMQCVFVGTLQSMIIPVFFVALQWHAQKGDLGTLALTILAIQLPLTALWASTSLEDRTSGLGHQTPPSKQFQRQ